jgi:hypothetical protein
MNEPTQGTSVLRQRMIEDMRMRKLFTRLPFGGGSGLNQLVGKPELDQRLPRHAESARFTVE